MSADRWGILDGFVDAHEQWQSTPGETREAIRRAMGADDTTPSPDSAAACVARQGAAQSHVAGTLHLEDGGEINVVDRLPPDIPLGYHRFEPRDSERKAATVCHRVIVCPPACVLPQRGWGWAAQLYATRSTQSWGIGDLGDLKQLGEWATGCGASFLLINPLGAIAPMSPQESSPYYPSSRVFRNPIYLAIEHVPGAAKLGSDLEQIATAGRKLNAERRIDRDGVFRLKQSALEKLWAKFAGDTAFDRYCDQQGEPLEQFAAYCVLVEKYGRDWHSWQSEFQRPDSPAVWQVGQEQRLRIDYHRWLQWLLDLQIQDVAVETRIVQDLPIGVDPGGFDAWQWQDVLARDVAVGAPPDVYNVQGQNWGLPPFVPHKLRESGYEPFVQTIRAVLRHAGGLRIDHVMGLFRLFWIPRGMSAADGAFVQYPFDDLLGIIALESHRAGAFVVGEDLGTVEPKMREALQANKMLSYRLLWFEDDPPITYPELALAAVSTHDLPTIAGVCTGSDFRAQQRLGMKPSQEANQKLIDRLSDAAGCDCSSQVDELIVQAHTAVAAAPSLLVTATLDDALAVEERPNMPGTTGVWPNWSLALPKPLEEIRQLPVPRRIAEAMHSRAVNSRALQPRTEQ